MKKALEWYQHLPEPIRSQAVENWEKSDWQNKHGKFDSLVDALNHWEWDEYWIDIVHRAEAGEFDQPPPNLHGWIPVSERLPTEEDGDEDGNVLTLNIRNQMEIKFHGVVSNFSFKFWQPLPKLPEAQDETN